MIKTPIEMLKFVQFIVNDGKEWFLLPEVIEQMKNYAAQFKQVEESDKDREIIEKMADNGFAASEAIMFGEWMLKNQLKPDYYSQELMWGNHDVRLKFGRKGYTTTELYKLYKNRDNL